MITCTPATYDAGSRSAQRPSLPTRRAVAATLASTASRDSSTRFGVPVDPDVSTTSGGGSAASSQPRTVVVTSAGSPAIVSGSMEGTLAGTHCGTMSSCGSPSTS